MRDPRFMMMGHHAHEHEGMICLGECWYDAMKRVYPTDSFDEFVEKGVKVKRGDNVRYKSRE